MNVSKHEPGAVSSAARLLGYAGLLPQLVALLLVATGVDAPLGALLAFAYALLILSFLGGVWWGLAIRRMRDQARLVLLAVVPTLAAFALIVARLLGLRHDAALGAVGVLLLLTLLVDRSFDRMGEAPAGWLRLRTLLSVGLAALTIATGALAPREIALVYSG